MGGQTRLFRVVRIERGAAPARCFLNATQRLQMRITHRRATPRHRCRTSLRCHAP